MWAMGRQMLTNNSYISESLENLQEHILDKNIWQRTPSAIELTVNKIGKSLNKQVSALSHRSLFCSLLFKRLKLSG